jgi:uncharacterized protein (DUF1684 family)
VKSSQAFLASLVAGILITGCSRELEYPDEIAALRTEKDAYMRSSDSPVPAAARAAFPPLPYFPIDESYRIPASLTVAPGNEIIELPTSSGTRDRMRRIGTLEFTLKGRPLKLTAFAPAADTTLRRLFVPFGDLTSGTETYQGGRYIDLDRTRTGVYDLDFNRAYHPFCVYNAEYICPIPPRENRLDLPIRAGEKLATR